MVRRTYSDSSSSFNPKMGTSRGAWYHSLLGTILHPTLIHHSAKYQLSCPLNNCARDRDSRLELLIGITPNIILLHKDLEPIIDQGLGRVGRQGASLLVRLLFASKPESLGRLGRRGRTGG